MKILHISDVHFDTKALESVAKFCQGREDLEVVVCSGDLLGQCLPVQEAKQMQEACNFIIDHLEQPVPFDRELLDFIQKSTLPDDFKNAANDYRNFEQKFDKAAEQQYGTIGEILSKIPQTILMIPGNWDSMQYFDRFSGFDIHKKTRVIDDIEFTGYGSDSYAPILTPYTRRIPYSEQELFATLSNQVPEIAVTHVPPMGVLDRVNGGENRGSWAGFAYIRNPEASSDLLLCGHIHEAGGAKRPKDLKTIVINAGNLGRFADSPVSGCFVEIDYEDADNISTRPYKVMENGEVVDIKSKGKVLI